MSDNVKITASICLCVVAVVATLVIGNIYSPASPLRSPLQECARSSTFAGSAFCMELVKSGAR